jgi:hypothetical protein
MGGQGSRGGWGTSAWILLDAGEHATRLAVCMGGLRHFGVFNALHAYIECMNSGRQGRAADAGGWDACCLLRSMQHSCPIQGAMSGGWDACCLLRSMRHSCPIQGAMSGGWDACERRWAPAPPSAGEAGVGHGHRLEGGIQRPAKTRPACWGMQRRPWHGGLRATLPPPAATLHADVSAASPQAQALGPPLPPALRARSHPRAAAASPVRPRPWTCAPGACTCRGRAGRTPAGGA